MNYDVGMVASNSMSQVKHVWPSQDGYKYLALPKMSSKYLDPPPRQENKILNTWWQKYGLTYSITWISAL